jgi:parallel beta-helix repeat protein
MKKLFAALAFFFLATSAEAATYWVRPSGILGGCLPSASAPATDAGYVSTVNAGIACLAPGDTLKLRTGTYAESITTAPPAGSSSAPTIIERHNTEVVTLRPLNGNAFDWGAKTVTFRWIVFRGIVFDGTVAGAGPNNGSGPGICCRDYTSSATKLVTGPNNFLFEDIEVKNFRSTGMEVDGNDNILRRVWVHNNATDNFYGPPHGTYMRGARNIIEDSDFSFNGYYGIHIFDSSSGASQNNIVRRTKAYNNGTASVDAGFGSGGGGILIGSGINNRVENSISYNNGFPNGGTGIQIDHGCSSGCVVLSSTSYGNRSSGIQIINGGATLTDNVLVGNSGAGALDIFFASGTVTQSFMYCQAGCSGTGTVNNAGTNAARFANPAAGDFRPCTIAGAPDASCVGASPLLVAGANLSTQFTTDFFNLARPAAPTLWTMGAIQSSGVAAPTIAITSPATVPFYSTHSDTLIISGTATAGSGSLLAPTWTNDRGGGNLCSGTTSWTCTLTGLSAGGVNNITVTATNTDGGKAVDSIAVAYAIPSLIASYGFGEGTGTTVADLSGNGHTATFNGSVAWGTGKGGAGGVVLTGGHLSIPALASLVAPVGSVTVSLTAKVAGVFTDFRALLVSNYSFYLYGSSSSPCGPGGVQGGGDGLSTTGACDSVVLPVGTDVDLAFTYDGINQVLYRDGVAVSTVAATGHFTTPTGNIQIGCSVFLECSQATISEVRLYNYARSPAEIAADRAARLIAAAAPSIPVLKLGPGVHKFQGIQKFGAVAP